MRILALAFMVVVFGCSKSQPADQENLVLVTGTVRYKGKPLAGALVSFTPDANTLSVPAFGPTKEDGTYELTNARQKKGLAPGEYIVTVTRRLMPDGSPVSPDDKTPPIESKARETMPVQFSDQTQSKLRATVKAGGGPIDFDLK